MHRTIKWVCISESGKAHELCTGRSKSLRISCMCSTGKSGEKRDIDLDCYLKLENSTFGWVVTQVECEVLFLSLQWWVAKKGSKDKHENYRPS